MLYSFVEYIHKHSTKEPNKLISKEAVVWNLQL